MNWPKSKSKTHFQAVEMFLWKVLRKIISAIVLIAIVVPLFTLGKTWVVAHNSSVHPSDVIVVLGAAQFNGRPSSALRARLVEAERIFSLRYAPMIITVGAGAPGDRTTEAASSEAWLISHGISGCSLRRPIPRRTCADSNNHWSIPKREDSLSLH